MFGFAAMLNWANKWAGCRHVLTFLLVALILGTWCGPVVGQAITIANPNLAGFTAEEQAAIQRAVDYWNEAVLVERVVVGGTTGEVPGPIAVTFTRGAGGINTAIANSTDANRIIEVGTGPWSTVPDTQLKGSSTGADLESRVKREIGFVLGFRNAGINVVPGGMEVGEIAEGSWADFLYTPTGVKLTDLAVGTRFTTAQADALIFKGYNTLTVWSDGEWDSDPNGTGEWDGNLDWNGTQLTVLPTINSLVGITVTPFGLVSSRDYLTEQRPFLSEVELAILQDIGHTIDISNYFGRSFYQTHSGIIRLSDADTPSGTGFALGGTYGIGLHLVAGGNRIVLDTNITTTGFAGAGIRIENDRNNVTINNDRTVNASGENGIGVLMTHAATSGSSGTTFLNQGRIEANGTNGTGVYINTNGVSFLNQGRIDATGQGGTGVYINIVGTDMQATFDNAGIINAGAGNDAISISNTGRIGTFGYYPNQAPTGINFMRGTTVVGNIRGGTSWQPLTFGKLADPLTGFAMAKSDPGDYEMLIDGMIIGSYDFEFWGGKTTITQDLNIPTCWMWIGYGDARSTLVMRGNADYGSGLVRVMEQGTLVAGTSSGTTLSLAYVQVDGPTPGNTLGGVISSSIDTVGYGRLTIDGDLRMGTGSTLRVNLGAGNSSDLITIAGATNAATISAINIDLTTLFAGTFTLVTTTEAGGLDYTPADVAATKVLYNGLEISNASLAGRRYATTSVVNDADTNLQLTVSPIVNTLNTGNYRLTWTGAIDGTTWDFGAATGTNTNTGTMNWKDDAGFSMWFQNGDAVTFGLSGTNTINITPAGGVTVGEMLVTGEGNWIFNGDIAGVQTPITEIGTGIVTNSTGGLTMNGTGSLTLNGSNLFAGDIMLDGGTKVVDTITHSKTIIGSGSQLATAQNLSVGTTGFARLDLINGGNAGAAGNVYIGGGNSSTSEGIVNVGELSTLATSLGNVYVGGDGTSGHDGRGILAGRGTVASNVYVDETGVLFGGNYESTTFDKLTISGNLTMLDKSTLWVNLGIDANNNTQSSRVDVSGTANIGAININLSSLISDGTFLGDRDPDGTVHSRTYTLITSQNLIYQPNSATILLKGDPIPWNEGRWSVVNKNTQVITTSVGSELQLTINGEFKSAYLNWTGNADGTTWNWETKNWSGWNDADPPDELFQFFDGDAVTFGLNGTHTINIHNAGVVVADMVVSGNGSNWTFTGGSILGDGSRSTLRDADDNFLPGSLTVQNTSIATLLNDVEFKGGTHVLGALYIGNGGTGGSIAGNIRNDGNVIFNRSDFVEFKDNISGTGSLSKVGGDVLFLSGNNTYKGSTNITSGSILFGRNTNEIGAVTVQSGAGFGGVKATNNMVTEITLDGRLINNGGRIFEINALTVEGNATNQNGGVIASLGRFHVDGALTNSSNSTIADIIGTMTISGGLDNSGDIWSVGTLSARNVANTGLIADVGTMTITNNLVNDGVIAQVSTLTANSITNTGYLLNVDRLQSNQLINQNLVAGIQHIDMGGGTFFNQGGTIIVGDSRITTGNPGYVFDKIGTMSIDGDFVSSQGTFVIGIKGSESSVIDVSGSASVNGGTVMIEFDSMNYVVDHKYEFLKTSEGLTVGEELLPVIQYDPLFKVVSRYDDFVYSLTIARAYAYGGEGNTMNQRAMGKYLDQVGIYPGGDFRNVLMALDRTRFGGIALMTALNEVQAEAIADPLYAALDQMGGSIYGTMTTSSFQNTVMLHASLANVLRRDYNTINAVNAYYGRSNYFPTGNLWGMLYGHAGSSSHDGNVNGYRQGFSGMMVGFDRLNERQRRLGLFISAGQGSLSSELQDRAITHEFMVGHYFRKDGQYGYMLAHAGLGTHRYDTRRHISFGYFNPAGTENYFIDRTARNQHSAFLATAHFETGLRYRNSILNLSPFVGVQYTGLIRQGFTEHGAGSLNLTSGLEDYHSLRTMFGMRFDTTPFRANKGLISFYGNAAWSYEFEADKRHSEFTARFTDAGVLSGPTFTVNGNDPGRDWVQAGFGLNYDFNANFRGFAGYDAYANQRQVLHSANLGIIWQK